MLKILVLVLLLFTINSDFLDYTVDYQINCNQIKSYSKEELWHTLILHEIDMMGIFILCPIAILCSLFIIFTYFRYPSTRKPPGDLFLAISIIDLLMVSGWLYYAIYVSFNPESTFDITDMPEDFEGNCKLLSVMYVALNAAEIVYNCCFSIYIIVSIKTTLKGVIKQWYYHVISLILIVAFTSVVVSIHENGLSIFGICAFSIDKHIPYSGMIVVGLYLLFSIACLYIFKKSVPKVQEINKVRSYFLKYYFIYIILNTLIWMIQAISNLVLILNCISSNPNPNLQVFATIGNILRLFTPILLSVIRFKNPSVNEALKKVYINFKIHLKQLFGSAGAEELDQQNRLKERLLSHQEKDWLDEIKKNLRSRQIYSFLYGILKLQKQKDIVSGSKQDKIITIEANQEQKILSYKIIQHLPAFTIPFRPKNYAASFNLEENIEQIYNEGNQTDGGKSGEFFFFTSDKKFILKTISSQEVQAYKTRMEMFYNYYKTQNKQSLIVKIFGLFTFISLDDKSQLNLIFMKNLAPTSKSNIFRTYDLKGSTYKREVLKKKQKSQELEQSDIQLNSFIEAPNNRVFKQTLKDVDFMKLEKKIYIDPQQLNELKQILLKDVNFLQSMKLIDYSLIIMICGYTDNQSETIKQFCDKQIVRMSVIEQGTYYHFGIVDYLQLWNLQKNMEKKTKEIINIGKTIDTSAQDNKFYAERFKSNVIKSIFEKVD